MERTASMKYIFILLFLYIYISLCHREIVEKEREHIHSTRTDTTKQPCAACGDDILPSHIYPLPFA